VIASGREARVACLLVLIVGGCGGESGAPFITTTVAANASCGGCTTPPCTRECLPALASGPVLPSYSLGECPALVEGWNQGFGHNGRDFVLFVPHSTNGPFGLVFLWHGSGGNAEAFRFLAERHDADGYVLVIPDGQVRYPLDWAMDVGGIDDDLLFFDDVVACAFRQLPIDLRRVHSTGYSAGAVFSAYLMGHRSRILASFSAWSTGENDPAGRRMVPDPPRSLPGLLYHGGPDDVPDWAGRRGTLALAAHMTANGALALVCDHGLGHVIPGPLEATLQQMWSFMLAHPFGEERTWAEGGLTGRLPDWCTVFSP
jgi:predicted esterase